MCVTVLAVSQLTSLPLRAQVVTPADSAAVLLETARRLEADGQRSAAEATYQFILRRYAGTPAADQVAQLLATRGEPLESGGRFRFVGWGAMYGAWLGVAVPAAFGAEDSETYGIGLLLGGPAGLLGAMHYARAAQPTRGQADAMVFGTQWGTWQTVGWMYALDLDRSSVSQTCDQFGYCYYEESSDESFFRAAVLGGLGGLAAGTVLGRKLSPTEGQASFVSNAAGWGTWFGLAGSIMAEVDDGDAALSTMLVAGSAGLVAGALLAPRDVTPGRVWLTTAVGMAGAAAGLGVDLIVQPDNAQVAMLFPAALSAAGLAWGWQLTKPVDLRRRGVRPSGGGGPAALIEAGGEQRGLRLGVPGLQPGVSVLGENARGRRVLRPALSVPLFRASF